MFSIRGNALAVLAVFTVVACAPARLPSSSSRREARSPTRHVLPNGIPLIVEEHRQSDVVAVQLWVKAGSRDETESELGLAHYLEHLVFKGTPIRPPGFIDHEIERVGGRVNAGTSLDYTYYHAVLPARHAVATIEMLADVSVNAALDASLLEREKSVVLEEMRRNDDSPDRLLSRHLFARVFDGHPYGRPIIGRADVISSLSREILASFYRRHYGAESFALVVVGAVAPGEVLATATRAFGRLPRTGSPRLPMSPFRDLRPSRDEVVRPGTQTRLGMAWLGPRIDHADTAAMDLLVSILGERRSSRLTVALRERLGLVRSIRSSYSALQEAGVVTVTALVDPADLGRAEAAIVEEIKRLREGGVTEIERRRAVTSAEAQQEFSTETAEGRAFALGRAETVWRLEDELAYVDRLRSVTAEQMRAAARRYLDPQRYARVALVPPPSR